MGRQSSASLNVQLTNFAVGHMNDLTASLELAERLCPTVGVTGSNGQFKSFDDVNSFQVYNTSRALGGDPTRIEFSADDEFFNCKPQALEVTVDEKERQDAGEDNAVAQQLLDEGKIKALLNGIALSNLKKRVDFVLGKVVAEDGLGQWSNPAIDPIDQLDSVIVALATLCGNSSLINVTMSLTAWATLRNHPKSKARCNGVQAMPLTIDQVKNGLTIPVDMKAYAISYNAAQLGQVKSKKQILVGDVLVQYSMPSPTVYDPSAFKRMSVGQNSITAVRSYMAANGLYGGHFVDYSEDLKQTSTQAMKRITLS
jgi:hypothetical protein